MSDMPFFEIPMNLQNRTEKEGEGFLVNNVYPNFVAIVAIL